jgi:putative membrane protein
MMDFGYGFVPFMGFGFIFMIFFWGLIVWGFVAFVRWVVGQSGGTQIKSGEGKSAVEILKERYAKGEVDKNEYDEKMKDLKD